MSLVANLPVLLLAQDNVRRVASTAPKNFFFRQLTTKNGLSYNLINCLHQDREGYIWVGTFDGLNRFDGQRFVSFKYDRTNSSTIAHNNILDICEDKSGNLWIATVNGVSQYQKDKNQFVNYLLEPNSSAAFSNNVVNNILCTRDGTIWATSLGGVFEFLPAKKAFKAYKHDPKNRASLSSNAIYRNALVEDPSQPWLWIGSGKGLNRFDTRTKEFTHYRHNSQQLPVFTDHPVYPLAFDRRGNLLFGDEQEGKLVFYHPSTHSLTTTNDVVRNNSNNVLTPLSAIYADAGNNLWTSAWNRMVYHRDAATNAWIQVKHDNADPSSIVSDFFWDALQARDGTVYIGGLYGLSVYEPSPPFFTLFNPADALPELKTKPDINALVEDKTGKVWMATNWNGLVAYDFTTQTSTQYPVAGHATGPVSIEGAFRLTFMQGELWIFTTKGVYLFNPTTCQYRKFTGFSPGNPVSASFIAWGFQDKQKTIWFNQSYKSLIQYNPLTNAYRRHNLDSLSGSAESTSVTAVGEDAHGDVWFGTYSGRLYHYLAATDRFVAHVPDPSQTPKVLQQPINDLWGDPKGNIWLASEGGGLIRYNPAKNQFKSWMQSDGLLMDVCKNLLVDRQGKIWVGTYEGFTVFDPITEKITNPRIDYGQRENNFFLDTPCQLRNGKILFANAGMLILIDPDKIRIKQSVPSPVISGLAIFEKSHPLYATTPPIELTYKENFFTLTFSSLTAPLGPAIEYAYRLTNYDNDWVMSANRTFAAYTGVKGGHYRFEVKARNKDGVWSAPGMLSIYIHPPFWETWWFRIGTVGIVIGLLVLAARRREKRLVREQLERSELRDRIAASEMKALRSQMNPHFLYNSLNAIRLFVLQNDSDNADKYLVKFARLMRLILENSRQEWVTLASELEQLQLYLELEQLRFNHKFTFSLLADPALPPGKTSIPPMIIQPYIENAILHGIAHKKGTGTILVRISPGAGHLECIVEDDGVGRQKAGELKSKTVSSHTSVGLRVTEERLQLISQRTGIETRITIIDKLDEMNQPAGTKVVIFLPLMPA